ncbi:MAG: type VI secretion system tip protein VgrG, partial [Planctomycetes bacterium]|nr:type VI secretion system tip protein VgrG [Planctomycetota bacterium]
MPESRRDYITFVSQAPGLDPESFLVASVEGTETIGRPFRFELELLSRSPDLDFQAILREAATLGIKQGLTSSEGKRGLVTVQRHGVLAAFEQVGSQNDWTTYRAVLVPPLWRLGLTHQSRIFQNLTVPEMVSRILQDAGIPSDRFRFLPASRPYAQREYVVQYEETDLDFVHRWLEHEGIFYWFRHEDDHVVAVFGDSQAHAEDLGETVSYVQAGTVSKEEAADSAFDWYDAGRIGSFSLRQVPIPKTVVLREYNWRTPLESLEVAREVSPDGIGLHYEYNNHYKSAAEGQELARIRAEEIRCRERVAEGRGTCRTFHAGACFVLADHYRPDFNASFLLTEVRHRATQDVALATNSVWRSTYGNEFTAIPNDPDRPFRPERSTPWPEIKGVMHARVDGTPGAASAEVDSWGRYKVKLPLDRSEAKEGESSRYVRMAQPNAGPDGGFHFPLKPGVEVVLSHMDGDPDRPIITGAVPNPETRSPVGTGNEMDSVIQTPGGK